MMVWHTKVVDSTIFILDGDKCATGHIVIDITPLVGDEKAVEKNKRGIIAMVQESIDYLMPQDFRKMDIANKDEERCEDLAKLISHISRIHSMINLLTENRTSLGYILVNLDERASPNKKDREYDEESIAIRIQRKMIDILKPKTFYPKTDEVWRV